MMGFVFFFWTLILAAILFLRWSGGGRLGAGRGNPELEGEVTRLREELDRLSVQVDRLSEEQSFMVRLLAEGEPGERKRLAEPDPDAGDPS